MATRTCSVSGCDRPYVARGWCRKHYDRWARSGGDPAEWQSLRDNSVAAAVLDLLEIEGGWWTMAGIAFRLQSGRVAVAQSLHRLKRRGAVVNEYRQGRWEWKKETHR